MKKSHKHRKYLAFVLALALQAPGLAHAELFPEGIFGVKLGQTRAAALEALVGAGVVPDLDKAQCSDKVPERQRAVADRICKLPILPGTEYEGQALAKVSLLLKDDGLVLMGLFVGPGPESHAALLKAYSNKLGEPAPAAEGEPNRWADALSEAPVARLTHLRLWNDAPNAFLAYGFQDVQ